MKKFTCKTSVLSAAIAAVLYGVVPEVNASLVRNDVNYQEVRDIAENKGQYVAGAAVLKNAIPMVDFGSADRLTAATTLIAPQYVVSVAHNTRDKKDFYWHKQFGKQGFKSDAHHYDYAFVDENNYNKNNNLDKDYQVPRLNKLVTEVAPSQSINSTAQAEFYKLDSTRYPVLMRVGSGTQGTITPSGNITVLASGYNYLVGGAPLQPNVTMTNSTVSYRNTDFVTNVSSIVSNVIGDHLYFGNNNRTTTLANGTTTHQEWDNTYGIHATNILPGDSGSPLFAYDAQQKIWVLAAIVQGGMTANGSTFIDLNNTIPTNGFHTNGYITLRPDFNNEMIKADEITIAGGNLVWNSASGHSTSTLGSTTVGLSAASTTYLSQENATGFTTDIVNNLTKLNNGKTLHFTGDSTITLNNSIDQGAGALYFHQNATVKPQTTSGANQQTWLGAGVSVDAGKKVIWQVHNPEYDRLSKIGKGELYVNGAGVNKGDISVGDGVVVLAQQADSTGKQAFKQVGIVSGRATVVLADSEQVKPDNIYFGSGGGRLDVNGNNLTFSYIQNNDEGARIVNHNGTKEANIKVTGRKSEVVVYSDDSVSGSSKPRYVLLGDITGDFPAAGQSNKDWKYLANDRDTAFTLARDFYKTADSYMTYEGFIGENDSSKTNGKLNFTFAPTTSTAANSILMLSGGTQLNGSINVEKGTLLLSGRPTPHAMDYATGQEVIVDNDWQNRTFTATQFNVSNAGKLVVGRNVESVTGNFNAADSSTLKLGFKQGDNVCIRSDYNGFTNCTATTLSNTSLASLPITNIQGKVTLKNTATMELGRSQLTGTIQADTATKVALADSQSRWVLTGNSSVGSLSSVAGSEIKLNNHANLAQASDANTLTVKGNLTGNNTFKYLVNLTQQVTDKVVVEGIASGTQTLKVNATGTEPKAKKLYLLNLTNANQTLNNLTVTLQDKDGNSNVDVGAYRYTLKNDRDDAATNPLNYYLYNPKLAAEEAAAKAAAEKAAQEAAAKAAAEKAAQEAAAKAAAEKAAQEAAAKAAAEKAAQEAAAKAAAEKAAQEAAAKAAAEKAAQEAAAKAAAEKAAQEAAAKAAAEKAAQEAAAKAAAEKAAQEAAAKAAAEKAAQEAAAAREARIAEIIAKYKAEQEAAAKAEAEKVAAEKAAKEAEQAKAAKDAAEKAAQEAAIKAEAEKAAQEAAAAREARIAEIIAKYKAEQAATAKDDAEKETEATNKPSTEVVTDNAAQAAAKAAAEKAAAKAAAEKAAQEAVAKAAAEKAAQEAAAKAAAEKAAQEEAAKAAAEKAAQEAAAKAAEIKQKDVISRYSNAALSEVSSQVNALVQIGQSIDERVLIERRGSAYVWANSYVNKTKNNSDNYRQYEQDIFSQQVGAETPVGEKGSVGAFFTHSRSDNDFADNMTGKGKLSVVTLFGKKEFDNGIFVGVDGSVGHSSNKIKEGNEQIKFSRNIVSAGANLGKKFELASVNVQPSVGVRYHHLSDSNYQLNGANVNVEAANIWTYNAGMKVSKDLALNSVKVTPSLAAYYVDASNKDLTVKVNNSQLNQRFGRYGQYEAGVALQFNNWGVAASAGYLNGNEVGTQKMANFEVNYAW